jgi:hypothetical protein
MININKIILVISVFISHPVLCGGMFSKGSNGGEKFDNIVPFSNNHTNPFCCRLSLIFNQVNFTLSEIQQAVSTCECCKKRAFTTLIHYIEKLGYEKSKTIADLFIQNGISVNDLSDAGKLPIIFPAEYLMLDAVNFLISLGADVNKKDRFNETALYAAMFSSIYKEEDKQIKLNIIKNLLKAGADPNTSFPNSATPLSFATKGNLNEVVYLLLLYGADPTIAGDGGKNFFYYAKDNPEVLAVYKRYLQEARKLIFETISKKEGFDQDMPDALIDIINEY